MQFFDNEISAYCPKRGIQNTEHPEGGKHYRFEPDPDAFSLERDFNLFLRRISCRLVKLDQEMRTIGEDGGPKSIYGNRLTITEINNSKEICKDLRMN